MNQKSKALKIELRADFIIKGKPVFLAGKKVIVEKVVRVKPKIKGYFFKYKRKSIFIPKQFAHEIKP